MEKLIDATRASVDPTVRKAAFDAVQQYQYDNVLFIPLYARANVSAYTDHFVFPKTSAYCYFACPSNVVQWDVK